MAAPGDQPLESDVQIPTAREQAPFDPPPDYAFEPELRDPPMRSIPGELRWGRHGLKQWRTSWGFVAAGLLCIAFGLIPVVQLWGQFLLPLQYLIWIGVGCLAIGAICFVAPLVAKGPYRYVEEGVPLVARICDLAIRPTAIVNGMPAAYAFFALIEYRDPDSGEIVATETKSNEFSVGFKEHLTTSYRVGDYATAVYLPSNPVKTLRLYGFLDLKPGLGLLPREGAPQAGLFQTLALIVVIFGIFAILGWNVYAYSRYAPIEMEASHFIPFGIGVVLLGGALLAFMAWEGKRQEHKLARRNEEALATGEAVEIDPVGKTRLGVRGWFLAAVLVLGAMLLGGMTMMCWAFTANALLDSSPPEERPVRIQDLIMTTHGFIFREYTIEYRFPDEDETKKLLSTPDEMTEFFQTNEGIAEVHEGRFGWKWVKTVRPVPLPPPPDDRRKG